MVELRKRLWAVVSKLICFKSFFVGVGVGVVYRSMYRRVLPTSNAFLLFLGCS